MAAAGRERCLHCFTNAHLPQNELLWLLMCFKHTMRQYDLIERYLQLFLGSIHDTVGLYSFGEYEGLLYFVLYNPSLNLVSCF